MTDQTHIEHAQHVATVYTEIHGQVVPAPLQRQQRGDVLAGVWARAARRQGWPWAAIRHILNLTFYGPEPDVRPVISQTLSEPLDPE